MTPPLDTRGLQSLQMRAHLARTHSHPDLRRAPMLAKHTLALQSNLWYNYRAMGFACHGARAARSDRTQVVGDIGGRCRPLFASMHNDEETTHARLTMLLTDAAEPSIVQHGGRVVKNTGDGASGRIFGARSRPLYLCTLQTLRRR